MARGVGRDGEPSEIRPSLTVSFRTLPALGGTAGTLSCLSPRTTRLFPVPTIGTFVTLIVEETAGAGRGYREAVVVAEDDTRGRCGVIRLG